MRERLILVGAIYVRHRKRRHEIIELLVDALDSI